VLVAPLLPFLLKTNDSPDGIDQAVFDGFVSHHLTAALGGQRPGQFEDGQVQWRCPDGARTSITGIR
jgi:hypothetical protein